MSTFTYGMQGEAFNAALNELDNTLRANVLEGKKLAILGDSQDVNTWQATAISTLLLDSVINVAKSGARHNDLAGTAVNLTTYGDVSDDNCLSNQVRRLVQDSFALGAQITWTHPITGYVTTIDIGKGVGLGLTPPDLIYIKMGENGAQGALSDADFATAIATTYGSLDRLNQFTALQWAIDTLNIVFPTVPVFIVTPINSISTYATMRIRADLSIRMAKYKSCPVINVFDEMGMNRDLENASGDGQYTTDGIHPYTDAGKQLMGRFISNELKNKYISRV